MTGDGVRRAAIDGTWRPSIDGVWRARSTGFRWGYMYEEEGLVGRLEKRGGFKNRRGPQASETQSDLELKHKPPPLSGDRDIDVTGQVLHPVVYSNRCLTSIYLVFLLLVYSNRC